MPARARAALGGRSAATQPDAEQEKRIKQLERALKRPHFADRDLKKRAGRVSGGQAQPSQAGQAIEQSVAKVQEPEPFVRLTAVKEERLPITKSEALMNQ